MSDYYAFGMLMVGRNWSAGEYRYGFNGKENDDEVSGVGNHQDYGLRVYDPRLGRFLSVDPLAPEFPWNSNYAFAEDDVIRCVDLDGAERFITTLIFGDDNKPSLNITDIHDIKKRSWNWKKFKWNYYVDNSQQIIEVHTGISHKGAINGRLVNEEIKFTFESVEEVNNALATGGLSKEAIEKQLQFFQNFDLIAAALENVAEEHRLGHVPFSGAMRNLGRGRQQFAAEMREGATEWANMQIKLAPSKRQASQFNTVSVVYDAATGSFYYGANQGIQRSGVKVHPKLAKKMPNESLNDYQLGNCAECDAVNQALWGGAKWKNLYLHTVKVSTNGTGQVITSPKPQCANCNHTFKGIKTIE